MNFLLLVMRKTLPFTLAILISLFSLDLIAQSFAPLGTVWTYQVDDFWRPGFVKPVRLSVDEVKMFKGELCSFLSNSKILTERADGVYFYSEYTDQFELLYPNKAEAGDTITILGLSDQPAPKERCVLRVTEVNKDTLCDQRVIDVWDTEIIYDPVTGHTWWEIFGKISPQLGSLSHFMFPQPGLAAPHVFGLRCYELDTFFCNFTDHDCDALVSTNSYEEEWDIRISADQDQSLLIENLPTHLESRIQVISIDGKIMFRSSSSVTSSDLTIPVGQSGLFLVQIDFEGYEPFVRSIMMP